MSNGPKDGPGTIFTGILTLIDKIEISSQIIYGPKDGSGAIFADIST
jgi:hypothetical protein